MFTLKGTAKLCAGAALALALVIPSRPAASANGNSDCPNGREIALINGRIHTMDASNSVVSAVTMRNGKFVSVGHDAHQLIAAQRGDHLPKAFTPDRDDVHAECAAQARHELVDSRRL